MSGVYKPSEHGGLKENGEPDKRMSSEHGFGADHERASELGKQGGHASGDSTDNSDGSKNYSSKDHDGLKQDGTPDKRLNSEHGFGGDRGRASEAGKKGGQA